MLFGAFRPQTTRKKQVTNPNRYEAEEGPPVFSSNSDSFISNVFCDPPLVPLGHQSLYRPEQTIRFEISAFPIATIAVLDPVTARVTLRSLRRRFGLDASVGDSSLRSTP